jgi:hypothetical protein
MKIFDFLKGGLQLQFLFQTKQADGFLNLKGANRTKNMETIGIKILAQGGGEKNANLKNASRASFRFDIKAAKLLTDGMNAITSLTPAQLRTAANLKEKIAALQKQLDALLGAAAKPVAAAKPAKKKRTMSASARARIAAAQKARWAKIRAEKKK